MKQVDKWVACKAGYFPIDTKSTHRIYIAANEKWGKTTESNIENNIKILGGGVFARVCNDLDIGISSVRVCHLILIQEIDFH